MISIIYVTNDILAIYHLIARDRPLDSSRSTGQSRSTCWPPLLYASFALESWLNKFLFFCMCELKLPKIWRRALVVAIPKLNKTLEDPKRYRPISLLCVPFKILERLIDPCIKPIIDPLLSREQAEFWHERLTVYQVTFVPQEIENSCSAKKEACTMFVDLAAAMILYGSLASSASFLVFFQTGTWSY